MAVEVEHRLLAGGIGLQHLKTLAARMLATPDQQISLTDPDSRSMATSGRGSGVVGYNVQVAVDIKHHLIVTHDVTNVGNDRSQLARMSKETKATLGTKSLDVETAVVTQVRLAAETFAPAHPLELRAG